MKKSTSKTVVATAKSSTSKVKKPTTGKKSVKPAAVEQPKKVAPKEPEKKVKAIVKPVAPTPEVVAKPVAAAKPVAPTPRAISTPKKPRPTRMPAIKGLQGVGRRKSAIARVWLTRGQGTITVNERAHDVYFDSLHSKLSVTMPFRVVSYAQQYDVHANVQGGGLPAQADAVKLGFARALLAGDANLRPILRQAGLLTVDSRVKERKKYGRKAARRRFQFVKR